MKKILIITWLIFSCIVSSESFAQATLQDPDLKLSIEALKKKYPISLLDEKKKNYKEGQKINLNDYSIEEIKAAFLNANKNFKENKPTKRAVTTVDGGFMVYKDTVVFNKLELAIIEDSCVQAVAKDHSKLSKTQRILQSFIFSDHKIRHYIYPFISEEIYHCLSVNDPLESEDRQ